MNRLQVPLDLEKERFPSELLRIFTLNMRRLETYCVKM